MKRFTISDITRRLKIGAPDDSTKTKTQGYSTAARDPLEGLWQKGARTPELLKKLKDMYRKGGLLSEALDLYTLYMFGGDYTLEGDDEPLVEAIREQLDKIEIQEVARELVTDALITGDGFAENVRGRGEAARTLVGCVPIAAETMRIITDARGALTSYEQKIKSGGILKKTAAIPLQPAEVTHLRLISLPGEPYGVSLLERAMDEIYRDTRTSESTAAAIQRHGFPKYHIAVGNPEDPPVDEQTLKNVEAVFEDIETDNEFVTTAQVRLANIDSGGLQHVQEYNDVTLQRLCAALGVPEELLGLRRGSTDATAVSRISAFFKKCEAYQRIVESCLNKNLINRMTGRPGAVRIRFADVSPDDEVRRAEFVQKVCSSTPGDPFAIVSRQQLQEYLGYDPAQWEEQEGEGAAIDEGAQPQE